MNRESINKAGRLTKKQRNCFFRLGITARRINKPITNFMADSGQKYYEESKEYFQAGWNQENLRLERINRLSKTTKISDLLKGLISG